MKVERTQDDLIYVSERFSIWRDSDQWFLYDFHGSRLNKKGNPRMPPQPTYHPKLEQLVDTLVERGIRDDIKEDLDEIVEVVDAMKDDILGHMQNVTRTWGKTPADECEKVPPEPSD